MMKRHIRGRMGKGSPGKPNTADAFQHPCRGMPAGLCNDVLSKKRPPLPPPADPQGQKQNSSGFAGPEKDPVAGLPGPEKNPVAVRA